MAENPIMNDTPTLSTPIRLGVFYDGGWFNHLWRWADQHSQWRAAPSFPGIHDALRWHLHHTHHTPLQQVTLVCAHYVLGRRTAGMRGAAPEWDLTLRREGLQRHDARVAGGHEIDADKILGRVTEDRVRADRLNAVALITGDTGFIPLLQRLRDSGTTVIVPSIHTTFGEHGRLVTTTRLLHAADQTPLWTDLLTTALEPAYPLAFPFTEPVEGVISKPAPDGYWYGTINHWPTGDDSGFITDRGGRRWFATRSALPAETPEVTRGQPVRFTGRPRPTPGHEYPRAITVRPFEPTGPLLFSPA